LESVIRRAVLFNFPTTVFFLEQEAIFTFANDRNSIAIILATTFLHIRMVFENRWFVLGRPTFISLKFGDLQAPRKLATGK
jgi:hypothetical protein